METPTIAAVSEGHSRLIRLLNVDDMRIAGASMKEIIMLMSDRAKAIEIKDLGAANQILARISRD